MVRFFGEDPGKMRIDDFFGTFASFITDFEVGLGSATVHLRLNLVSFLESHPGEQTTAGTGGPQGEENPRERGTGQEKIPESDLKTLARLEERW